MCWHLYILECKDRTLYTGITNNLEKRLLAHTNGSGAKYTKGRGPFKLLYQELCKDRGSALKREIFVKTLTKKEKLKLIRSKISS
ncbi:MAG: GIY-YIG nuclease family protein [SAR86 cluster bacterium]|nr:GIY-YIG nuclease family protein [SAR86 cluster bacterium]